MELIADLNLPSTGSTIAFLIMVAFAAAMFVTAHIISRPDDRRTSLRNILVFGAAWLSVTGLLVFAKLAGPNGSVTLQTIGFVAIIVFVLSAAFSDYGKRIALGLSIVFLVGLHIFRLPLELVLHQWWQEGFLPAQMTYSGDNFDIITGILAVPVALAAWQFPRLLWPVWAFNIIGLLLLARIISIVNLSNPTPIKALFGGYETGVFIALFFPYVWIATAVVPIAMFFHIVLFRRLLAERSGSLRQPVL